MSNGMDLYLAAMMWVAVVSIVALFRRDGYRFLHRHVDWAPALAMLLALLAGCATPKPPAKTAVPAVTPASMAPTAPTAEAQPALEWRQVDVVGRDGASRCECAQKPSDELICRNCKPITMEPALDEQGNPIPMESAPGTFPLTDAIERELAERHRLLKELRLPKPRKVSFQGPPGQFNGHWDRTPYGGGHAFVDSKGQHYFCPFRPGCDRYADKERLDEACLDYSNCLQVSVDNEGNTVW